jgi:hypothetical protein
MNEIKEKKYLFMMSNCIPLWWRKVLLLNDETTEKIASKPRAIDRKYEK